MTGYAEFAVTTNFSFLRGASHGEELVMQAKALGLAGLSVADRNSVAGVVRAHQAAKEAGLVFAPGARLMFCDGTPDILAYPESRAGWGRLTQLLTLGKRRAGKGECLLRRDDLLAHVAGLNLIVMPQRLKRAAPEKDSLLPLLAALHEAAPRVWLGASMRYRGDDARRLARLAAIAGAARVPLLATGDVLYHAPERRPLQDVMTCIREHVTLANAGRRLEANAERHLKPPQEMARLFRDAPEAVDETLHLLERCRFSLDELKYEYPDETREGYATSQEALIAYTEEGARRRYPDGIPQKVRTALDHEFALIATLNYAPYFLTVYDIVRFARSQGILCQGRGSAANSAVCYCLGVTDVDPARIDLLFERFVSADRNEPPDIDVDFEHERREIVIQYIYRRYGRHRAGLAATVICYRARSAIREVGKVFGLSEDTVGALAGMLWGWSTQAVSEKDARRVGLDPSDPQLARVLALARELIGFPRHLSQHVGGFVITRGRLDEVVPIENAAMEERTCVEWDKDDLDAIGILKIDVLALGMLTCLQRGFDLLNKHYLPPSHNTKLPPPLPGTELVKKAPSLPSPVKNGRGIREAASSPPSPVKNGGGIATPSPACGGGWGGGSPRLCACRSGPLPTLPRKRERDEEGKPLPTLRREPKRDEGSDPLPTLPREERGRDFLPSPASGGGMDAAPFSLAAIPPEDPAIYRMLSRADSIGVFQVESRAQMSMLPRLKPQAFYDLVIEVAIVRPGPIQGDMVHPYLRRRQGVEKVVFPSPSPQYGDADELQQVLGKTMGVPLFQEQAMRIAIVAAGFTPAEADKLRRAMATFRRVGTIQYFRDKLVEGMAGRGYPRDFAERCFRQIEGFGEYGFPESHAASFALLVYASAWMKCRYPDVFAAALLNSQPMGFYAPAQIVRDAQEHGVEVRPVDVNHSDWDSTLEPAMPAKARLHRRHAEMAGDVCADHALRLGFRQISGFSEDDGRAIERCRGAGFDSIRDLWLRSRLKPAALERLAAADAFGSLGLDRRAALWAVRALRRAGDKDDLSLFAHFASPALEPDVDLPPMRLGEQVVEDYRRLHMSLKAHPVSFLRGELARRGILRHEALAAIKSGRRVTVAGLVLVRQRPGSANGVIFMTLEDETAVANTIVWPQVFETFRPIVLGARLVSVTGKLQNEFGVVHVVAERLDDLTPLLKRLAEDTGCVEALVNCDEVKRPIPERRLPPAAVAAHAREREYANAREPATNVPAVMPKGRNFH
jgi:error-prone DNA polymerase